MRVNRGDIFSVTAQVALVVYQQSSRNFIEEKKNMGKDESIKCSTEEVYLWEGRDVASCSNEISSWATYKIFESSKKKTFLLSILCWSIFHFFSLLRNFSEKFVAHNARLSFYGLFFHWLRSGQEKKEKKLPLARKNEFSRYQKYDYFYYFTTLQTQVAAFFSPSNYRWSPRIQWLFLRTLSRDIWLILSIWSWISG